VGNVCFYFIEEYKWPLRVPPQLHRGREAPNAEAGMLNAAGPFIYRTNPLAADRCPLSRSSGGTPDLHQHLATTAGST
jgi:hypothetical protein